MSDCLTARISYMELVRLLKAHEFEDDVAETVADYLTECVEYELDLEHYIWNTLLFNVQVLDSKEESIQYVNDNLCCELEDCKVYETGNGKCYLEW